MAPSFLCLMILFSWFYFPYFRVERIGDMKILLLVLQFFACTVAAQSYEQLQGVKYKSETEVVLLRGATRVAEKEDTGGYWCIVYHNAVVHKAILTVQKEKAGVYTMEQVMPIDVSGGQQEFTAGIADSRESDAGYWFVVAIEKASDGDALKLATSKVNKAWGYNTRTGKFEVLKARKVIRIGEVFSWM